MPLPKFPADAVDAAFVAHASGLSWAAADGADVDDAFDQAGGDPVFAGRVAHLDPARVTVTGELLSLDQAIAHALVWRPDEDGQIAAFGVTGRAAHARRTVRAKLEDVALDPACALHDRWCALDQAMRDALAQTGEFELGDGEFVETVEIKRRARYKPVHLNFKGKAAARHAGLLDGRIVTDGHPTATAARRAVVELLKDYSAEDHTTPTVEVLKLVGRTGEDGPTPLVTVERTRVRQTLAVKAVVASVKESKKGPANTGWLFVFARP